MAVRSANADHLRGQQEMATALRACANRPCLACGHAAPMPQEATYRERKDGLTNEGGDVFLYVGHDLFLIPARAFVTVDQVR
eukprot:6208200-Pleurochrysis_carterae.AAC.2